MEKIQIKNLSLFYGDCMEYMQSSPDAAFDLAIVDPPYGLNMGAGRFASGYQDGIAMRPKNRLVNAPSGVAARADEIKMDWDKSPPDDSYFTELFRVSKNQIIWGGNYFFLPPSPVLAIWDKMQPFPNFSAAEIAWTSFRAPFKTRLFQRANHGIQSGVKWHPTQKPKELYAFLLKNFATPGIRVLDTHLGSASIAISAHFYGVSEFIGIEIQRVIYDAAVARVKEELTDPLFEFGGLR